MMASRAEERADSLMSSAEQFMRSLICSKAFSPESLEERAASKARDAKPFASLLVEKCDKKVWSRDDMTVNDEDIEVEP
ncbi:uncharacterized protein BJ212DRAFT_1313078 [Suillus subaureus]|uniref:Uncharacterized protein n=1 Tax=Suillus subaureus TaxID=48587 RepID=A0A9P7JKT5_9AGAM|nr:uncharacterized protein BJ212DRAFT_1313078 [Suillus subaureus]KAG1827564.1 hypothetical protein BJ212DRAFT_1313078 [Suillus subaureus]